MGSLDNYAFRHHCWFCKGFRGASQEKSGEEIKQNVAAMALRRQAFRRAWEKRTGKSEYKKIKMPHSPAEDEVQEFRVGSENEEVR